jgi:hypothetical protein
MIGAIEKLGRCDYWVFDAGDPSGSKSIVIGAFASRRGRIGHCRTDGHLGSNFLHERLGNRINAVMRAVGYNLP